MNMEVTENTVLNSQEIAVMESPAAESSTRWRGPLFVIGMWRSGTSLLYALLNKHPEIALLYEGDLLALRPLFLVPGGRERKLRRWEFWNRGLHRHGLDESRFSQADLSGMASQAYRQYADQKGALIAGEKSPNYFDSIARLARDFPDARFIVIWRDPAAICNSVLRAAKRVHSWFNRKGMCLRVLLGMQAMRTECDRLVRRGARLYELSYESLVRNPTGTMKEICRFLEIPFIPEMASLEGADRSAIYADGPHEQVRSERITSSPRRTDVLPEKLKRKITRYLAFWHETYGDRWPQIPHPQTSEGSKPSLVERVSDKVRYGYLRLLDAAVILVYCFAPIWLLRRFRSLKHQVEEVRAKGDQAQVSSRSAASDSPAAISHSE